MDIHDEKTIGDNATTDEIYEIYPDLNGNQISNQLEYNDKLATIQSQIPLEQKINDESFRRDHALRMNRKTCNTGSKGVRTDYEIAQRRMVGKKYLEQIKRRKKVYLDIDSSNDIQIKIQITNNNNKKFEENIESEDEEDIEIFLKYKKAKYVQLSMNNEYFGELKELTAQTYFEEIEKAPKDLFIILHIYQIDIKECTEMNYALQQLAHYYPYTKFMKTRNDQIGLYGYPKVGMPTIIVFKNGKQFQVYVGIHRLVHGVCSPKNIQQFY